MKKLMVIEDDASIRDTLRELLENEGYAVSAAEHGLAALSLLGIETPPDVILLDLSMPVMDGKTFLHQLAISYPGHTKIPIIIMTAAGVGEIPANYPKEMILRKPLDVDVLMAKIEDVAKEFT